MRACSRQVSTDTVAAIATAPGKAGVAVVRVSGPDALPIGERLSSKKLKANAVHFARLRAAPGGDVIDESIVLYFRAPNSFTGEDVVEFQCHGGDIAPKRVLEAVFAAGARLARRGEFAERAFLNGKISFEEAEALLDLVNAKTDGAADDALRRMRSAGAKELRSAYESALEISTSLEHTLDVDESSLPDGFFRRMQNDLRSLSEKLSKFLAGVRRTKILRDGALVALAGPPNAGKSSLLNALVGEDRAIVSPVAGTTRDTIEQWIDIEGYPILLVDTAGLRDSRDDIETEGVKRAMEVLKRADVVLALDADIPGALKVHSKCDISPGEGINVSAKTLQGLEELKSAIVERVSAIEIKSDVHNLDEVISAKGSVEGAIFACGEEGDVVLAANFARAAADVLAKAVGASYSHDMLESLFSRFCVGK